MARNRYRHSDYVVKRAILRGAGTLITLAAQQRTRERLTVREALNKDTERIGRDFRWAAQREAGAARVRKY